MKRLVNILFLILAFHSKAQVRVLTYGGPPSDNEYQRYKIAKEFGFILISIGQCTIEQNYIDSAEKLNEIAYQILDSINGKGWEEKYELKVQETYVRDTALIAKIKGISDVDTIVKNSSFFYCIDQYDNTIARCNILGRGETGNLASLYRVYVKTNPFELIRIDKNEFIVDPKTFFENY